MGLDEFFKIGDILKYLRKSKGIAQKDMARKLGIALSTYSNYENDNRTPNKEMLERICGILGVSIHEILSMCQQQYYGDVNYSIQPPEPNTLAAHFDGDEYTEEELEEIRQFAEFVKSKRKDQEQK